MDTLDWDDKDSGLPESDPRRNWRVVDILELKTKFNDNVEEAETELDAAASHISNTSNPHSVTKTQVGLGNADNTSDANKEVSGPQQTALNLKANINSQTFTGAPTLPTGTIAVTQLPGDNSTKIATTAFVAAAVTAGADAKVADAINNGTTTIAPSQNAVFDALALKANTSDVPLTTTFVDDETPSGTMNDINVTFTLANTPISGTVKLYWNGMRMKVGVGFTISTATLTMAIAPSSGDTLAADYRK